VNWTDEIGRRRRIERVTFVTSRMIRDLIRPRVLAMWSW